MVKESYCSFEVSQLLKEKGFDAECRAAYTNYGKLFTTQIQQYITNVLCSKGYLWDCTAPTHQMAMKWLREKGIHMSIDTVISSSGNIYFNIDTYSEDSGWNHPVDFYDSYEEAVEAALKYTLENLI